MARTLNDEELAFSLEAFTVVWGRFLGMRHPFQRSQGSNLLRIDFAHLKLAAQANDAVVAVRVQMPWHGLSRSERLINYSHLGALRNDQALFDLVGRIAGRLKALHHRNLRSCGVRMLTHATSMTLTQRSAAEGEHRGPVRCSVKLGSHSSFLNDLICPLSKRLRNAEAKGFRRLEVDGEVDLCGLLDGKVRGLGPF